VICAFGTFSARAQEGGKPPLDYSAGKTPAQLFASDCTSCHKSPQGLARGKDQSSIASFLRAHYTTKPATAGALAAYLAAAGPGAARAPAAVRPDRAEPAPQRPRQAVPSGEAKPPENAAGSKPRLGAQAKRSPKPAPAPPEVTPEGEAAAAPSRASPPAESAVERPAVQTAARPPRGLPPRPRASVPGGDGTATPTVGTGAAPKPATARTPRAARHAPTPAEDPKLKSSTTSGDTAPPSDGEPRKADQGLSSYARSGADAQTLARERAGDPDAKAGEDGKRKRDSHAAVPPETSTATAPSDVTGVTSDATHSSPGQTGTPPKPTEPVLTTPAPVDAPSTAPASSIDH
jgi:hypothetical protein